VPDTGNPIALKAALRHDTIRRAIEVDGRVSIADLKDRLDVSEVTIRGDLEHLEAARVLKRIRGGAVVTRDGDISCADLLVTDSGANPSVLANLRAKRLKVVTADPGAG
jgi:DeoR/GlpR family transcriptional regulator of sugar metabolism